RNLSGPGARHGHVAAREPPEQEVLQRQRCAGRGVALAGVMRFLDERVVGVEAPEQLSSPRHDAIEDVDPDREVCRVDERTAPIFNQPTRRGLLPMPPGGALDRKSTRLNSSHVSISYAVFCLKKK